MKILITGAKGYLGSKLIKNFLNNNHEIIAIDVPGGNEHNLNNSLEKITLVYTDDIFFEQKIINFSPQIAINTACMYESDDYLSMANANYLFPLKIINICLKSGVNTFINTNSALPKYLNKYTLFKEQFGEWGKFYVEHNQINFVNLKLEHFYGEDEPDNHFIKWVIKKLKNNEILELTEGTQKRDFVYIEDIINIYKEVIKTEINGYINISVGTGITPSIREIIEFLHNAIGSKSQLKFGTVPMRQNEPNSKCDITVLKSLGLSCDTYWKDGMKKIIGEK